MSTTKKTNRKCDQSRAQKILARLARQELEATPANYQLFHDYVTGANPLLVKKMHSLIKDQSLDQSQCTALYEEFFKGADLTDEALFAGNKISTEMDAIIRMLTAAERNAAEYGKTLCGATDFLEDVDDEISLKETIDTLVAATTKMQLHSQTLESKLNKTTEEIEKLRNNLEEVRAEAMTDSLTGVANRKRFDECLQRACKAAETQDKPLSLIFCDIDHFKRFNDTWGHQTGDQIIRFVASVMHRHTGKDHLVARYGGEEFAIILPDTDLQTAFDLADNIRTSIESKKLLRKSTNEDMGTVTISLGVAAFSPNDDKEDLVERADEALYCSKRGGRNKTTLGIDKKSNRSAA